MHGPAAAELSISALLGHFKDETRDHQIGNLFFREMFRKKSTDLILSACRVAARRSLVIIDVDSSLFSIRLNRHSRPPTTQRQHHVFVCVSGWAVVTSEFVGSSVGPPCRYHGVSYDI